MNRSSLLLAAIGCVAIPAMSADNPPMVFLWTNGAPGTPPRTTEQEIYEPATPERNYSRLTRIHNPSLIVYLPPEKIATGAAVIICPGGAHRFLAIDHEGYDVGRWLAHIGVAGFVLKYRLAHTDGFPYTVDTSVGDALRAIRVVRSRAAEWHVDPARVGIMGFSAGGELAALAAVQEAASRPDTADPVDRLSSRPDFQILVYPGGPLVAALQVPAGAPPAFLACAYDDQGSAALVGELFLRFKKAGVPAELHIYARGGHGFGMRASPLPVGTWTARVQDWMADQNLLRKP
ncbi:MAG TPA: alpha/beta hydrolase [Opitutaceae bacterium]|nr:alpha/beta hydrolase [Opitutaceae bacterium]